MTQVLVTGAAGLVGGQAAGRLRRLGATVVGVSRREVAPGLCNRSFRRAFGEPLREILRDEQIDAAVHCAHDVSPHGSLASEQGVRQWAEEAYQAGVARQVFVSSISARPDARAAYGQVKYRLEQWFLERGATVVRLGLVIGDGGLFGRMIRIVKKAAFVPLIGSGRNRVYFNDIDFVSQQLAAATMDWREGRQWNLQQPEPTTMRELLVALRDMLGARAWFIPVPYYPALAAAWVLDRCRITGLGISYDNVVGLRQNDVAGMPSDFVSLGGQLQSIREVLDRVLMQGAAEARYSASQQAKQDR